MFYQTFQIVHQICFHTVNDLEIIVLSNGMICIRERLYISVVCDGDGLVSPFHGTFDDVFDIGNTIHITHFCMAVQFHTFHRTGVHTGRYKGRDFFNTNDRTDGQLTVKPVNRCYTFDLQKCTFRNTAIFDFIQILIFTEHFYHDRIGKVGNGKHQNRFLTTDRALIHRQNLSTNDNFSHLSHDLFDTDCFFVKISTVYHIRIIGSFVRTTIPEIPFSAKALFETATVFLFCRLFLCYRGFLFDSCCFFGFLFCCFFCRFCCRITSLPRYFRRTGFRAFHVFSLRMTFRTKAGKPDDIFYLILHLDICIFPIF